MTIRLNMATDRGGWKDKEVRLQSSFSCSEEWLLAFKCCGMVQMPLSGSCTEKNQVQVNPIHYKGLHEFRVVSLSDAEAHLIWKWKFALFHFARCLNSRKWGEPGHLLKWGRGTKISNIVILRAPQVETEPLCSALSADAKYHLVPCSN